jgi:hypothetical protein
VAEFAVRLPAGAISTSTTTSAPSVATAAATTHITPDKVRVTVANAGTMAHQPLGRGRKLKKSLGSSKSPAFTLAGTSCECTSLDIELEDGDFDRLYVASVAARTDLEQQGVLQAWSPADVAAKFDELRASGVDFDTKHMQMLVALEKAYDQVCS